MKAAQKKPLPVFNPEAPRATVKEATERAGRSRRGHVRLASGTERGRLSIWCAPEMRRQLVVMAAEQGQKVSSLAEELISEALLARRSP